MLGELRWKLVKIRGQLNLATQHSERVRDRPTARQRYKSRDRPAGAFNDDLLTTLGEIHEPRQLALGFMHSDSHHTRTVARP